MDERSLTRASKFLSLVLRHKPQEAGLSLDEGGWVGVRELLEGCARKGYRISRSDLQQIVDENNKKRFAISEDGRRIRASQGHSVNVELGLEPVVPPDELYHGTAERNIGVIMGQGLLKISRQHVHLSADVHTARTVGSRHGKPVIFCIAAATMHKEGHKFYQSANGVWLIDHVPVAYLSLLGDGAQVK